MSDVEFKKEVDDLVEMLNNFRLIKDKGLKRWLKVEIRNQLNLLIQRNE
jgi:D-hexose-6-phosphate mutarotase